MNAPEFMFVSKKSGKAVRIVIQNEWPHVAVDFDARGEVLGVEAVGVKEFTIAPSFADGGSSCRPLLFSDVRVTLRLENSFQHNPS